MCNDTSCELCGGSVESVAHALFWCSRTSAVWFHSGLASIVERVVGMEFVHLGLRIFGVGGQNMLENFLMVAWGI